MNNLPNGLDLQKDQLERLATAAHHKGRVKGLTHEFYRYPARFSPTFVREVIDIFTETGDWIIDPFVGGGTTLVEAMSMGRNAIGIDINSISSFLCEAKTQILEESDVVTFQNWKTQIDTYINMHSASKQQSQYADAGYYRTLECSQFWRLRKDIEQALESVEQLSTKKSQTLARCVVLKTAQWALDARKVKPSTIAFKKQLSKQGELMLRGSLDYKNQISNLDSTTLPVSRILNRSVTGAEHQKELKKICPPKLIITSPPYPGVRVLYHRWQINGRKEAPAPFWIAGKLDGADRSFYTLGNSYKKECNKYFENLKEAYDSISAMAGKYTTIVQMVGFAEPEWQLKKYLEVMEECGLKEYFPWNKYQKNSDGRLWREVPNRKWHTNQKPNSSGSKEVLLIHRNR